MRTIFRTILLAPLTMLCISFTACKCSNPGGEIVTPVTDTAQQVIPTNGEQGMNSKQRECRVGDSFVLTSTRHGSVGMNCYMEYDHDAFDVKESSAYDNPQKQNTCGGDRQTITYKFTCKKRGTFVIRSVEDFRGELSTRAEYSITVK